MPEGPSIIILKELAQPFKGKRVIEVNGNATIEKEIFRGQYITDFKSWGKHFLICFEKSTIRIHLMMFGSYQINDHKAIEPRLALKFNEGELNFYACSVKLIHEPLDTVYDWSADIMSDTWDPQKAKKKLKQHTDILACDALLTQDIFAGSGNIIKNEVLFRTKIHPESYVAAIPQKKLQAFITEIRNYAFDFLKWKKQFTLKQHWQAHTKQTCPRCKMSFTKKHTGKTNRRSFFCNNCQKLYKTSAL